MCAVLGAAKSNHLECNVTSAEATPNVTSFSCSGNDPYNLAITSDGKEGILLHFKTLSLEDGDQFFLLQDASDINSAIFHLKGPWKDTFTYFVSDANVTILTELSQESTNHRTVKGSFYTGCRETVTGQDKTYRFMLYQSANNTSTCTVHVGVQDKRTYLTAASVKDWNLQGKSTLEIQGINLPYTKGRAPVPFELIGGNYSLIVHLDQSIENQTFTLLLDNVNKDCSGMGDSQQFSQLSSPVHVDSLYLTDVKCRWVLKAPSNNVLGIGVHDFGLTRAQDFAVVTDGGTEDSPTIVQAFQSDSEHIKGLVIRSSGQYLWVSLAISEFTARDKFSASVSAHAEGGHMYKNGSVSITRDNAAFLLEVDPDRQVLLSVPELTMKAGAHVLVYTDFSCSSFMLQDVTGSSPKYPIVSTGHRMLLLSSGFGPKDTFKATFTGVEPGCHSVTLDSHGFYSLSGHCNSSCSWVVRPPVRSTAERLLVSLSHLSMGAGGELFLGTLNQQALVTVNSSSSGVPPVELDMSEGAYVRINRGVCSASDANSTAAFGVVSTVSGETATPELQLHVGYQFRSPHYPNQYPLNTNQSWQFSRNGTGDFHLTFKSFDLRPGHSLVLNSGAALVNLTGSDLPRDFVVGPKLTARFTSPIVAPYSSGSGFDAELMPADDIQDMFKESGFVETPSYPAPVKNGSLFFWSVGVPVPNGNKTSAAVQFSVFYNVSSVPKNITDFLLVYDGDSVRSPRIVNLTDENILSRTNMILVKYMSSAAEPAGIPVRINFTAYYCNKSDTCHHSGNCIHEDWRCNGVDDCGDNTDELNCGSQPIPPSPPPAPTTPAPGPSPSPASGGVSSTAFAVTVIVALALGIAGTLVAPMLVRRYRAYRYSRFSSVSVSE